MITSFTETAAVLALLIGVMSTFAGISIIIGKKMKYHLIEWLPIYNLVLGILSAFFVSIIIWTKNSISIPAALTIFASHSIVMLILKTKYRNIVAKQSIKATLFRIIIWLAILILLCL